MVSGVQTHGTGVQARKQVEQNENLEVVDQMNSNEGRLVCVASCDEGWV